MQTLNWLEPIGNWNPQLVRELKGRFKLRNILLTTGLAGLIQIFVLMYFAIQLPTVEKFSHPEYVNRYCTGAYSYSEPACLMSQNQVAVHWQLWWFDIFLSLGFVILFGGLAIGSFMLISDLSQEERRGTLNFLRLTPQSTAKLLLGKLLGTPSLLYLAILLILPLYWWSGLQAEMAFPFILMMNLLWMSAGILVYSAALLFGLTTTWLGGLQPWLGSGTISWLIIIASAKGISHNGSDVISFFSPANFLLYGVPESLIDSRGTQILGYSTQRLLTNLTSWQWFNIPIGDNSLLLGFFLLNYLLWTQWIWKSINRYFRNTTGTILSKTQSYAMTVYWVTLTVGFLIHNNPHCPENYPKKCVTSSLVNQTEFIPELLWVSLLFLVLIMTLSPQRSTLQTWSRYHQERLKTGGRYSLIQDLIFGEKSPAIVAISINAVITGLILLAINQAFVESSNQLFVMFDILLTLSFYLILASLVQNFLFIKSPKRALWAAVAAISVMIVPPIAFLILSIESYHPLWLVTAIPWDTTRSASMSLFLQVVLGNLVVFAGLTAYFSRQLKLVGESQTKTLLMKAGKR